MSSSMNTILIIGGTSGIGAAFAKRFHSMGKKVIITGRRKERLNELQKSMSGLETYSMNMTDLDSLSGNVGELFKKHPSIDTVWVNGGVQVASSIKDASSTTDKEVSQEITTNVTAPMILARHVIPKLIAKNSETNFMITSSGLGFMPIGSVFPIYCSTKAAVHQYCVGIRQALKDTNVNVLELVPPYVATELDATHKEAVGTLKPMPLDEFTDKIFSVLNNNQARNLKELAAGTAVDRVNTWRGSIGKTLAESGLGG